MSSPALRSQYLLEILPELFPWSRFLVADDRVAFAQELVDVMVAPEDPGLPVQVIAGWRHTAEIYADPDLLAALRSEVVDATPKATD
jgi:hypothetical protein